MNINRPRTQAWWILASFLAIGLGILLRFWRITDNQFLFYDEGMYLGYNRKFLNLVAANPPKDINEFFIILNLMFTVALSTAKALWFLLLNLRVFILGSESWYFARILSAVSGIITIVLTYLFAHKYFQSRRIAVLSAVFLSLLPSHVFYSRLGMQESLSALLFLLAISLYLFHKPLNWKTIVSAVLLVCLFLTNYRMIVAPIFIVAIELFEAFKDHKTVNWVKTFVFILIFSSFVFFIGSLYGGANRYVTFGWIFHQAQEAEGQRNFISFFSYPYYVFALEGILFALMLLANFYFVIQKQWSKVLPFILVLLQMGIFSFAAEKGARYLCVVLPLMAMAAAVSADWLLSLPGKKYYKIAITLACLFMVWRSLSIVNSGTEYAKAVHLVISHDPKAKIVSTQPLTEQLYVQNENDIKECPKDLAGFVGLYKQGYQYLILDPQAYISWTKDSQRFSPPLINFLEDIRTYVPPLASLVHLNPVLLERFVLDHNQNLLKSVSFLKKSTQQGYGQIQIYDISQCLIFLKQRATQSSTKIY